MAPRVTINGKIPRENEPGEPELFHGTYVKDDTAAPKSVVIQKIREPSVFEDYFAAGMGMSGSTSNHFRYSS